MMETYKKKAISLLLSMSLIFVSFSLAACGSNDVTAGPTASQPEAPAQTNSGGEESGKTDETESAEITVTDQAGRNVVIKEPVERIVSGYYISTSACLALGLRDKLAGVEAKAESRPIYALAAPELMELPNVGTAKEFNMEACIALEPDIVILPKRLKDSADIMEGLGISVILVDPENHDKLVSMLRLIGEATGTGERAEKMVAYYDYGLSVIAARSEASGIEPGPTVYMCGNGSYLSAAPGGMYQHSLIEAAMGINAAGDIDGDSWTEVSYEQIMAMNPEVIVIPAEASYSKADILGDKQLADVSAVRDGRVYEMPKDFEAWDSPVPSCTLGIFWLFSALHEDAYPMDEMRAEASAFYMEFYGAEIDAGLIGK